MNISTKGRYGLRAMLDLAEHYQGKPVTLSAIAQRQGLSDGYLEHLMVSLKREQLVKSVRGVQGGYILAKPPEKITAGDIFRALEGPVTPVACVSKEMPDDCERSHTCAARLVWRDVRDTVSAVLESYTLASLLAYERSCCDSLQDMP